MNIFHRLREAVVEEGAAALITVTRVQGSTPREAGARMVVRPSGGFNGTIGGGALEWRALESARQALARGDRRPESLDLVLGPDLGQCCGGRASVAIEIFGREDLATIEGRAAAEADQSTPLLLFGAGHVGRALILALAPLPFQTRWIDTRADIFPVATPANVELIRADDPLAEIDSAPSGAFGLVMTHSHALDFDIVARLLGARRFAFVGLIGSETKRARFVSRLRDLGLGALEIDTLVSPIGAPLLRDKSPAVIAAATAVQLLAAREGVQ